MIPRHPLDREVDAQPLPRRMDLLSGGTLVNERAERERERERERETCRRSRALSAAAMTARHAWFARWRVAGAAADGAPTPGVSAPSATARACSSSACAVSWGRDAGAPGGSRASRRRSSRGKSR
eukprot:COSAG03_NODE_39_length_17408_cov_16.363972_11_plen_125_part_00